MKILIPMAGRGKRFEEAGYSFPKPLSIYIYIYDPSARTQTVMEKSMMRRNQ